MDETNKPKKVEEMDPIRQMVKFGKTYDDLINLSFAERKLVVAQARKG